MAETWVERALVLQRPRGPDHTDAASVPVGGWTVVLGHNRLCVIDLAPTGHQPMWGAGRRAVISYNGEIYNYLELRQELESAGAVFTSRSDTEVLLAAWARWGAAALDRLNGMFAIALLDLDRAELVLARDRFGVKPLYYQERPAGLWFASTLAPLVREGCEPDLGYLRQGLVLGAFEDESGRSPYLGIRSVPPGCLVRVPLGGDRIRTEVVRWYDFAERVHGRVEALAEARPGEARAEVRALLEDAVALRLRSDVPVGVSLSGGLDSSSVAAIAARVTGPVQGITFGHPDAPESEAGLVGRLAAGRDIAVQHVWPDAEAISALFWGCLRAQQAPFASPSVVAQYAVFQRARALGLTVMLGGQGGDEGFMGYRKYHLFRLQEAMRTGRPGAMLGAAVGLARLLWGERAQAGLYWSRGRQYATGAAPGSILRLGDEALPPLGLPASGGSRGRQVLDILRFSLPTLLRYEDRNSMGHSIESRLPFLDYRLMELGAALPIALKVRDGHGKWILRTAVEDLLPREIAWARMKRGFDVRADAWFAGGLGAAVREALRQSLPGLRDLVAPGIRVDDYFADSRLVRDRAVFADAVALLWLGGWAQARAA